MQNLTRGWVRYPTDDICFSSSIKVKSVFISELALRRRKLLCIAETQINPRDLSELRGRETGLPDAHASKLWDTLIKRATQIDQSLRPFEGSLFSLPLLADDLKRIYEAGFTDLDQPDRNGWTPIMNFYPRISGTCAMYLNKIGWMIEKGANIFRNVPGTNTTVLHSLNGVLADSIHDPFSQYETYFSDPHAVLHPLWKIKSSLFCTSIRDSCLCPCSIDGCTPLSVGIRRVASGLRPRINISTRASKFRQFLEFLLEFEQNHSKADYCHAMLRSLTFDGLGLRHTCCTEVDDHWFGVNKSVRDECELHEIRAEQKLDIERYEILVSEFKAQFDALGLPLMDFLQSIWYERMIKFLSECDPCDSVHQEETAKLGIFLNMYDAEIPLVVQYMCD